MASKSNGVSGIVAGKILGAAMSRGRARFVEDAAGTDSGTSFTSVALARAPRMVERPDGEFAARPLADPASEAAPAFQAADATLAPDMSLAIASSDKFAAGGNVEQPVAQTTAGGVFINEFNYDNPGTDTAEFIEIAAPAGTNLSGYSLVLYNGTGGVSYGTINLSGVVANQSNGFGFVSFSAPGLQNGAPDGIALVGPGGVVIEFISYEGAFVATNGPANGMTSTDVGVADTGSDPDLSVQRTGMGDGGTDFTFTTAAPSAGAANAGQTFVAAPPRQHRARCQ